MAAHRPLPRLRLRRAPCAVHTPDRAHTAGSTAQLVLGVARLAARPSRTATRPLAMPSGHACRLCPHSPPPAATLVRQSTSRARSVRGARSFYLGMGPSLTLTLTLSLNNPPRPPPSEPRPLTVTLTLTPTPTPTLTLTLSLSLTPALTRARWRSNSTRSCSSSTPRTPPGTSCSARWLGLGLGLGPNPNPSPNPKSNPNQVQAVQPDGQRRLRQDHLRRP